MPSRDEIIAMVKEVLQQEFDFADADLKLDTHLVDDLDLDSIDAIDMAVRIEEKTGLALSGDDLQSIQTIRDAVDLIHARL